MLWIVLKNILIELKKCYIIIIFMIKMSQMNSDYINCIGAEIPLRDN